MCVIAGRQSFVPKEKERQRDRVIQRVMEKKEKIRVKAKKDLET